MLTAITATASVVGSTAVSFATNQIVRDVAKTALPPVVGNFDKVVRAVGVSAVSIAAGHYCWKAIADEVNGTIKACRKARETVDIEVTPEDIED